MSVGKLTRYGLPFSNVVPTGPATNNIVPGRTLEVSRIKLGGTALTKAMLDLVRVKAGSKTLIEATGPHLDKINAYRTNIAQDAAFLDLFFADYSLNNELDRMVGAFDTSLVGAQGITQEIKVNGATAPVITPILIESAQQKDRSGAMAPYAPLISKLLPYPFSIANGGKLPVTVPFGPTTGSIIKRMHVLHTGNMTGATVKQDSTVVHESIKAENEYEQKRFGRTPQANMYTLDFVVDGDIRKALDTRDARTLEWLFDFSGADNGTIYVEYVDPLGNL
jgi:hypothetical protein